MNRATLTKILDRYRHGKTDLAGALNELKDFPSAHLGDFAQIDLHRELRTGHPEVIYCAGKTPPQVRSILERMLIGKSPILATRASTEHWEASKSLSPTLAHDPVSRTIIRRGKTAPKNSKKYIAVVAAGTSDLPVAEARVHSPGGQCRQESGGRGGVRVGFCFGDRIVDTLPIVERALERDDGILLEGQLGAMRDLDWGIYPYVTSSNPLAGFASVGAGIPPRRITRVIGVVKAYSTAVGEGPFPTELTDAVGDELRERAFEYGAATGRPRRVGWFDALVPRFAHRLNAFTELAVTKLDVLGTYDEIPFCVGYELDGAETTEMPPTHVLERARPRYERLRGWSRDISRTADRRSLPVEARAYLERIEQTVGAKVGMVGIGPERTATIL